MSFKNLGIIAVGALLLMSQAQGAVHSNNHQNQAQIPASMQNHPGIPASMKSTDITDNYKARVDSQQVAKSKPVLSAADVREDLELSERRVEDMELQFERVKADYETAKVEYQQKQQRIRLAQADEE